jgi:RND family efflux transporter MFP subunit
VKKGQVLASLVPAPSSPEEAARASLTVAEAEARAAAAGAALERAERLIKDEAISERELEDAKREARVAEEAVRAGRRAAALFSGASSGGSGGAWQLSAPIAGTVTAVLALPGAPVSPGQLLFRIVDERELWIRARVPEQDAARLRTDRPAHYQVAGLSTWTQIETEANDAGASGVTVGRTVDRVSRTVDVIYTLRQPDRQLRVGGLVQVSLPVGEEFSGVVVPRTAIAEQEGREVVYVQVDGEHFRESLVRTGPRSGELVGILHGLRAGERVVVRGAHFVKLADRPDSVQPHGHIH